jgi:hypothetical protein
MDHDLRPARTDALRSGAALALLGIGALGLLLPIVPGIPFLVAGAWLLRSRRPTRPLPLTSALSRVEPMPRERLLIGCLLAARRLTMAAESLRLAVRARRRQRNY